MTRRLRLRPLARTAVDAMLPRGMSRHVQEALGEHFTAIAERIGQDTDAPSRSALPGFALEA